MIPFNTRKSAAEYILMSDGYDGRAIVEVLIRYLMPGSSVLEIGMGPGRDIELLEEKFKVTGSDNSPTFIDMFREKRPNADLLNLDAVTLDTNRKFDCIYSNKVLHYLPGEKLKISLNRQHDVLNPGGILCHTLWYGDKEIEAKGMRFYYYNEQTILNHTGTGFDLLLSKTYREMDTGDSLLIILQKKS
jgi:SAM-dependent methyltransferase